MHIETDQEVHFFLQKCLSIMRTPLPPRQTMPLGDLLLSLDKLRKWRPQHLPKWCQFSKMAFDSQIKLSWSDQRGASETNTDQKPQIWGKTMHLTITKLCKWVSLQSNWIHCYQIFSLSTAYVKNFCAREFVRYNFPSITTGMTYFRIKC